MHLIKRSLWTLVCFSLVFSQGSLLSSKEISSNVLLQDFTQIADQAIPAVVSIQVKTKSFFPPRSNFFNEEFFQPFQPFFGAPLYPEPLPELEINQGSGFIVSSDGYIITNSHVVNKATEIEVILNDKRSFTATIIGQDPSTDVAVLKIDAQGLPYLKLANSDEIKVGQWAVAIGAPLGLEASLTVGVVSAKGRNNLDIAQIEDFIQIDAAVNRGNSGGPLLNLKSEVIGMNTAIISRNGSGHMGIGFAIPSNIIKNDFEQILESGTISNGFIGVALQIVDKDLAKALGLEKPQGALVAEVSKDSPAEKAGIKQGDVILQYNDRSFNTIGELRNAIGLMKPGSKLTLTIQRKDIPPFTLTLEVGRMPSLGERTPSSTQKENKLGLEVQELTPELSRSLGYGDQKGVVISKILPNSAAAWTGLKKGTLILSLDQQPVSSVDQFNKLLDTHDSNKPVLLLAKQGNATRFISLWVK
ncbi:putative periplasmic serine endoprotease DegP-like protein [Neochlamydia sp. TUME1]|uniref:Do family serine endopeptidase n=1 Tax=Neochlamydia sp. TUME1 TaxID=1478174 RepID=UPI00057E8A20|nr:Do family serine endopeptidase [Neochlamydia sp. TUME1]KIC74240.1 putative periplasmic serine endoprotease DegP-like protein [Neochlamydia sp. TUME1]